MYEAEKVAEKVSVLILEKMEEFQKWKKDFIIPIKMSEMDAWL